MKVTIYQIQQNKGQRLNPVRKIHPFFFTFLVFVSLCDCVCEREREKQQKAECRVYGDDGWGRRQGKNFSHTGNYLPHVSVTIRWTFITFDFWDNNGPDTILFLQHFYHFVVVNAPNDLPTFGSECYFVFYCPIFVVKVFLFYTLFAHESKIEVFVFLGVNERKLKLSLLSTSKNISNISGISKG